MKQLIFIVVFLLSAISRADIVQFVPDTVMVGDSSAYRDSVWVRVKGNVGHANCYYAPADVSLFYSRPNGSVDPNKVLSVVLVAKMAAKPVSIVYIPDGVVSDFWGFGISRCEIQRLGLM